MSIEFQEDISIREIAKANKKIMKQKKGGTMSKNKQFVAIQVGKETKSRLFAEKLRAEIKKGGPVSWDQLINDMIDKIERM